MTTTSFDPAATSATPVGPRVAARAACPPPSGERRAAAPRARLRPAAAPALGAPDIPGAGTVGKPMPAPGGNPRTWAVEFPAGMELLNANGRQHWSKRARITADLRRTAGWLARHHKVPALQAARIVGVYEPPDRRRRDPANWQPTYKACVDGLTDAGVFADDDSGHVYGPIPELGDVYPGGRIVLYITEIGGDQ